MRHRSVGDLCVTSLLHGADNDLTSYIVLLLYKSDTPIHEGIRSRAQNEFEAKKLNKLNDECRAKARGSRAQKRSGSWGDHSSTAIPLLILAGKQPQRVLACSLATRYHFTIIRQCQSSHRAACIRVALSHSLELHVHLQKRIHTSM